MRHRHHTRQRIRADWRGLRSRLCFCPQVPILSLNLLPSSHSGKVISPHRAADSVRLESAMCTPLCLPAGVHRLSLPSSPSLAHPPLLYLLFFLSVSLALSLYISCTSPSIWSSSPSLSVSFPSPSVSISSPSPYSFALPLIRPRSLPNPAEDLTHW